METRTLKRSLSKSQLTDVHEEANLASSMTVKQQHAARCRLAASARKEDQFAGLHILRDLTFLEKKSIKPAVAKNYQTHLE
eukprot:12417952-Karenia_brevis.AAC.1